VASLAAELPYDSQVKIGAGQGHGRERIKRAYMNVGTAAGIGDELRFMQFKSGDRLHELFVLTDGGCTAGAMDLGLYLSGLNHDGAVLDVDLFCSALVLSTATVWAAAAAEIMIESAVLTDQDRGKPLWEILAVGAGTDTVDPMLDYDLTGVVTTARTAAVTNIVVFARYTSGD
jgi:hypothetical protein